VTLPLLGPTIRVSVFFAVLGSLHFFDLMWVMTKGGPVNSTNTMATYMYTFGFQRFQLGYGAAVSLVIFLICFVFSISYQRFVMRRDLAGALTY
jgi:raffinose/stachyose/melibiose transport system permease protein